MSVTVKQFRRIQTTDNAVNLIQDQLQDLFKSICANPWVFGRPLPQVSFVAGVNQVQHGLGRNFQSFFTSVPITVIPGTFGSDVGTFGSNPAPFGTPGETFNSATLAISQTQFDRSKYVTVIASAAIVCDCFVY